MLFIKSLPETTIQEDIFNEVMQYFSNKNMPLTNLNNIASDRSDFSCHGNATLCISRMKSVAPYIFHIHWIVHRQHLVAKNTGGDMEEALNTDVHAINFDTSN